MQAEQWAVMQLTHGPVPSECSPPVQAVQVELTNPNSALQLAQAAGPAAEQVKQLGSQFSQMKEELVNWLVAQATHSPFVIPKPEAQPVQDPVVAWQAVQLEQFEQTESPARLKVFSGQAAQDVFTTCEPALQVRQLPVALEQVLQLVEQSWQAIVPAEKVPVVQAMQLPLTNP